MECPLPNFVNNFFKVLIMFIFLKCSYMLDQVIPSLLLLVLACEGTELKGYLRKQAKGKAISKHMRNGGINSFTFHPSPRMVGTTFMALTLFYVLLFSLWKF